MRVTIKEDKTETQQHIVNAGLGPAVVNKAQHDNALAIMEQLVSTGKATKAVQYDGTNFSISTYEYTEE